MATNTIELDPANAVEPRQATQLVGFKADGTMTAVNAAGFMAERKVTKNSDGKIDFDLITESGLYSIAGTGSNALLNSPISGTSTYGILEVLKVTLSTNMFYTVQRFSNIIDKTNCSVYQRVKTEKGSFSSWVLISRGGVNTLYSTNYQLTERKGGRHERDNRPCDRSNGHVSFRSVADWIEWLGRDEEDFGKESIFGDTGYRSFAKGSGRRCQRDFNTGDLRNQRTDSKCPAYSRIAHMYQASSSCSADIHLYISWENIYEVLRCRRGRLVKLVGSVVARKEAAV